MTTKPVIGAMICLGALLSSSFGGAPGQTPILITAGDTAKAGDHGSSGVSITININSGNGAKADGHGVRGLAITSLATQLAGSNWEADPQAVVRPGLYPTLKFNQETVEPADYHYEINPHDFTVRIFFNHGDTQLMLLTDNGQRLSFTFQGKDYSYRLTSL